MYSFEHDPTKNLMVSRFHKGGDEDQDFGTHSEHVLVACKAVKSGESRVAILVIIEKGHSLPSAAMRRKIAALTAKEEFTPYIAIITQNPMMRGVITALSWLQRARYQVNVTPAIETGLAWLETQRGESIPELQIMVKKVLNANSNSAA